MPQDSNNNFDIFRHLKQLYKASEICYFAVLILFHVIPFHLATPSVFILLFSFTGVSFCIKHLTESRLTPHGLVVHYPPSFPLPRQQWL